jgi:hypothetical protein
VTQVKASAYHEEQLAELNCSERTCSPRDSQEPAVVEGLAGPHLCRRIDFQWFIAAICRNAPVLSGVPFWRGFIIGTACSSGGGTGIRTTARGHGNEPRSSCFWLDLAVEHTAFEAGLQNIAQHRRRLFVEKMAALKNGQHSSSLDAEELRPYRSHWDEDFSSYLAK